MPVKKSNNLVKTLMQSMMFTNTSIYKKYADDDNFRKSLSKSLFLICFGQNRIRKTENK